MGKQEEWHQDALRIYRETWKLLERYKDVRDDEIQYYVEELREALLDLKQAALAEDSVSALQAMEEIWFLASELRSEGE